MKYLFAGGKPTKRGNIPVSAEHRLTQKLAGNIAQDNHKGRGVFGAALQDKAAAGMIVTQTLKLIGFYANRGAARAAIKAMQVHQEVSEFTSTPSGARGRGQTNCSRKARQGSNPNRRVN